MEERLLSLQFFAILVSKALYLGETLREETVNEVMGEMLALGEFAQPVTDVTHEGVEGED